MEQRWEPSRFQHCSLPRGFTGVLSVVVIAGFALLPFSTATVGAMFVCAIALFALSVFKPGMKKSKKAKAKNID